MSRDDLALAVIGAGLTVACGLALMALATLRQIERNTRAAVPAQSEATR